MKKICCFRWAAKAKRFSASGGEALPSDPLTRGSALDPAWESAPRPSYSLALCVLAMRVHPTFLHMATPLSTDRGVGLQYVHCARPLSREIA